VLNSGEFTRGDKEINVFHSLLYHVRISPELWRTPMSEGAQ